MIIRAEVLQAHLKQLGHEYAVWVFNIVAEWSASLEAKACVELVCRGECQCGASFQTQSSVLSPVRFSDDARKYLRGDTSAQVRGCRPHRFDFTVVWS